MLRALALALAATVSPAQAQDFDTAFSTPRLKAQAVVASDLVRIGDLVENAGRLAATPIFRAPDLGQTGTVQARRVVDAVLAHGMTMLDAADITAVTVVRASRSFTRAAIEERIARALAAQANISDPRDLSLTFDRDLRTLHAEPLLDSDLEVARAIYDPRTGRFDVMLELPGSIASQRAALRYTGSAIETATVLVLTRALSRGDVVGKADISVERRPKAGLGADVLAAPERAAGLAPRRTLRAGDVLRAADLMNPELVHRNEPVLVVFEAPGVVISVRAKALDSGAEGDLVNVVNTQSKRVLQGVVTGPGRVSITGPLQVAADAASLAAGSPARPRNRNE